MEMKQKVHVFSEWMVLQKHMRCMKCLNLYQISEVVFFILIGVVCSMINLSAANGVAFGSWRLMGAVGCIWITSFVVFTNCSAIVFDVNMMGGCGNVHASSVGCCGGGGGSVCWHSSRLMVAGWISFDGGDGGGGASSATISMLMPLCLANNFSNSIASRASRFSCKNLFHFYIQIQLMANVIICIPISGWTRERAANGKWIVWVCVSELTSSSGRGFCTPHRKSNLKSRNKQWKRKHKTKIMSISK